MHAGKHTKTSIRNSLNKALKDKGSWELFLLCVPCITFLFFFHYIPLFTGILIPFKNYRPVDGIFGSKWVGLSNFAWIFNSVRIGRAIRNSLLYGLWWLFITPIINAGMALLLFFVRKKSLLKLYQTSLCIPMFMSMVVVGFITFAVLSPRYGVLNQLINAFGFDSINVYTKPVYWPFILTAVNLWIGTGSGSLIYYAALMGIDSSLYDSAAIDGASTFQMTWHISIPHLIPIMALGLILGIGIIIGGNFDLHYLIPQDQAALYNTTDIIPTFLARSLLNADFTRSSAAGFLQSVVSLFLVIVTNAIVRRISPENSLF